MGLVCRYFNISTHAFLRYAAAMKTKAKSEARVLIRAVGVLQLKLLVGALRDLVFSPITLAAAALDLILLKKQQPRFFRQALRVAEHTDDWIDVWSHGRGAEGPSRENFDMLLARVEEVVRDPQTGARRARVLKRWAERQIARARQRAAQQMAARLAVDPDKNDDGA